jgi:rfaE bifunctional protein nucleotidyltransferase chain/domain
MKHEHEKIIFSSVTSALPIIHSWKELGEKIIFTNGCFDLLHRGHVVYLEEAKKLGDKLVLGLNSDASVRLLKGQKRPIQDFLNRASVLAALQSVDLIIAFEEETPIALVKEILPNILVKGGDYTIEEIAGAKDVIENGGSVRVLSFIEGESSSSIIERIKTV